MVRFVHAADLHLDAAFGGVDASDERVASALVRSTVEALDRVVDTCITRDADFLVIAGDLYNSADRSLRAELAFRDAMQRLAAAGIGAYVVRGNHDPADGWSAGLELPPSVVVFSHRQVERHEVLRGGKTVCAVYGRSYPTRVVTDKLAGEYVRGPDDPLAVAVLHANVGGRQGWDDYAPCAVEDLRAAGMDYWALGHVHVPGPIADQPPIVYSGSTQGLDPTEEGPRGCYVVELDAAGAGLEFVETASVLWRRLTVDLGDVATLEEARREAAEACDSARQHSGGRPIIARIELGGRSQVHDDLARPGVLSDLAADIRQQELEADPWIWVDRVRDATRAAVVPDHLAGEEGLHGDLVRLASSWAGDEGRARELLEEVLAPLYAQLLVRPELEMTAGRVIERARDRCLDLLVGDAD